MNKIDTSNYDTDKGQYAKTYEKVFAPLAQKEINLLELGVLKGGSLLLWRDYFKNGHIVGLDFNKVEIPDSSSRIRIYQGPQQDLTLLNRIGKENAPQGFDIIIDDASHIGEFTRISFWFLFDNYLKPQGIYIIEDWGTGYWQKWIDGERYRQNPISTHSLWHTMSSFLEFLSRKIKRKRLNSLLIRSIQRTTRLALRKKIPNHSFGMVGFIKELVDECAMDDITNPDRGVPPYRPSKFQKMEIYKGQVIVYKA